MIVEISYNSFGLLENGKKTLFDQSANYLSCFFSQYLYKKNMKIPKLQERCEDVRYSEFKITTSIHLLSRLTYFYDSLVTS